MKTYCSDCGQQTDVKVFPFLASLCLDCLWKFKKTFTEEAVSNQQSAISEEKTTGCSTTQPA